MYWQIWRVRPTNVVSLTNKGKAWIYAYLSIYKKIRNWNKGARKLQEEKQVYAIDPAVTAFIAWNP